MTQVHLLIQNELDVAIERNAATLALQSAKEEVINMRRILDTIEAERNSSVVLQQETLVLLDECKSSLEKSTTRSFDLEKKLLDMQNEKILYS
jgi:hypothetical protein